MLTILLTGLLGGIIRGLVGYLKYRSSYKDTTFMINYFLLSVAICGACGFLAAWVTQDLGINFLGLTNITPSIGFVVGYAGGDFIENVFKILTNKTSLFEIPVLK